MAVEHPSALKRKRTRTWIVRATIVLGLVFLSSLGLVLSLIWLYTSPTPRAFPAVQLTENQVRELERRLAEFQQALRQDRDPGLLALSAEELNALLDLHPSAHRVRDRLRFGIHGDRLLVETSLPLSEAKQSWVARLLGGRYLNAKAEVRLSLVNGRLDARTQRLWLRQRPAPGYLLDLFKGRNLIASLQRMPAP